MIERVHVISLHDVFISVRRSSMTITILCLIFVTGACITVLDIIYCNVCCVEMYRSILGDTNFRLVL